MQVASLVFVFITLQAIPSALLQKRIDLKRISRIEVAANAVAGLTGLILAWAGFGVWSLMITMLAVAALRALGLCWIEPFWRMPSFRFRGHMHVLKNGLVRTAENTLWYLCGNSGRSHHREITWPRPAWNIFGCQADRADSCPETGYGR